MKWLPPLCLFWFFIGTLHGQSAHTTTSGWRYEVLKAGNGPALTAEHGALTHNQLLTADGQVLVSTYAINVPDYQLVAELSPSFQKACAVMRAGGKYRFLIPVADFKSAARGAADLDLPGDYVTWEVDLLEVLPPKADGARLVGQIYQAEGPEAAFQKFKDLQTDNEEAYLGEWEINQLGYLFLKKGRTEEAIQILEYNVKQHPQSANAHDSLAEIYLQTGKKDLAAHHYRQSIHFNPENENARKKLAKLQE